MSYSVTSKDLMLSLSKHELTVSELALRQAPGEDLTRGLKNAE